jgi:GPH family glycoside/pentoside/hexuronide:cation symporter
MGMQGAGQIYYAKYNLGNEAIIPVLGSMMLLMFIPILLVPAVVKNLGKRNTVISGNILALVGYIVIALSGNAVTQLLVGNVISSLGLGFAFSLVFVLIADTVDYGEWKNGVHSEGFLSAAASFGQKLGTGVGSACAAWILAAGGYSGDVAIQSASALTAISFNYTIVPIIGCVISIILMSFYKVDKIMPQMTKELAEQHQAQN